MRRWCVVRIISCGVARAHLGRSFRRVNFLGSSLLARVGPTNFRQLSLLLWGKADYIRSA
jgi:hypothetical protein